MYLCNRQTIYQVRGTQPTEPVDLESKRRFYVGHRLHEVVQRAIESSGGVVEFYPEFEIDDPETNIAGHGDGLIIEDDEDASAIVLEIKSVNPFSVKYGLPKEEHVKQVTTYAVEARNRGIKVYDSLAGEWIDMAPLGNRLKGVKIVYLDKNDLKIYEYFLPYDIAWEEALNEKLYELDVYMNDPDSLPRRLSLTSSGKKPWPCNYCPFKRKCWSLDPVEIPPEEPF